MSTTGASTGAVTSAGSARAAAAGAIGSTDSAALIDSTARSGVAGAAASVTVGVTVSTAGAGAAARASTTGSAFSICHQAVSHYQSGRTLGVLTFFCLGDLSLLPKNLAKKPRPSDLVRSTFSLSRQSSQVFASTKPTLTAAFFSSFFSAATSF